MKARLELTNEEYQSAKKSFGNIYLLFTSGDNIPQRYVDTVLKWGAQLEITDEELRTIIRKREKRQFTIPEKEEAIDQLFDLVYMIYLDNVVEDVELEVTMNYAAELGFEPYVVGDFLKAIIAGQSDGIDRRQLKEELKKGLL